MDTRKRGESVETPGVRLVADSRRPFLGVRRCTVWSRLSCASETLAGRSVSVRSASVNACCGPEPRSRDRWAGSACVGLGVDAIGAAPQPLPFYPKSPLYGGCRRSAFSGVDGRFDTSTENTLLDILGRNPALNPVLGICGQGWSTFVVCLLSLGSVGSLRRLGSVCAARRPFGRLLPRVPGGQIGRRVRAPSTRVKACRGSEPNPRDLWEGLGCLSSALTRLGHNR